MKNYYPIIEKLGGRNTVFIKLRAAGYEIETPDALRMWSSKKRASIPGRAMKLLIKIAEEERVEFSANDFELVISE